jgi:rare lipoprotein A
MIFTVQVGSFMEKENAMRLKRGLESRYGSVFIREWNDRKETFYRVRVGQYRTEEEAHKLARRLERDHYSVYVTAD